jgi:hypothetical protein
MEPERRTLAAIEHYAGGAKQETKYMPDATGKGAEWQVSLGGVASLVRDQHYEFTNFSGEKIQSVWGAWKESKVTFLIRGLNGSELESIAKLASQELRD